MSEITKNFSGAEIEEAIVEAMHTGFSENREFTIEDLIRSIKTFIPLSYSNQEQISLLEEWANSGRARLASAL